MCKKSQILSRICLCFFFAFCFLQRVNVAFFSILSLDLVLLQTLQVHTEVSVDSSVFTLCIVHCRVDLSVCLVQFMQCCIWLWTFICHFQSRFDFKIPVFGSLLKHWLKWCYHSCETVTGELYKNTSHKTCGNGV